MVDIEDPIDKRWVGDMIGEILLTNDTHCMVIWPPQFGESSYIDARLLWIYLGWLDNHYTFEDYQDMTGQIMIEHLIAAGDIA